MALTTPAALGLQTLKASIALCEQLLAPKVSKWVGAYLSVGY
jgi:hypothetical protein